jgi:cyanophycinase-like exopeptidase
MKHGMLRNVSVRRLVLPHGKREYPMANAMAKVVLMGSGELAPSMVAVHRTLLGELEEPKPVFIDTTFGFQENADELVEKARTYFRESLGLQLEIASLRNAKSASSLEIASFKKALREANYIFAGPGSPSYALSNFKMVDLVSELFDALNRGATVCFASAAALTIGSHTVPVYEIYKAGHEPYWLDGLDLTSWFSLKTVVIPHFDNREGATHDTSCCYIGQRRLGIMELELPEDSTIWGIDEHTAVVVDASGRLRVLGKGGLTIRTRATERRVSAPADLLLGELGQPVTEPDRHPASLNEVRPKVASAEFGTALRTKDAGGVVKALAAAAENGDQGHLMSMLVELEAALESGFFDRIELLKPFVEFLLDERTKARLNKDFARADVIRELLNEQGIQISDTADGPQWSLATG